MRNKISGKTIFNVIVALTILIIFGFLCLSENGLADLLKNADALNFKWILMAIVCHIINMGIDAFLVYKFTKSHFKKYRVIDGIKASMVGQFFSAVTPGASGGQPMQIYVMSKQNVDVGVSTSVIIQKFVVYQSVLTFYSMFAILFKFDYFCNLDKTVLFFSVIGFLVQIAIILLLLLVSFNQKITYKGISVLFKLLFKLHLLKNYDERIEKLKKELEMFHNGNKNLYKNKTLLLESYVLTAVQLMAMFLVPYCIYKSFNLSGARVIDIVCGEVYTLMLSAFTPLPGGSGAMELASFAFFYDYFGDTMIKSAILLKRLFSYYLTILISAPFSHLAKDKKEIKIQQESEIE